MAASILNPHVLEVITFGASELPPAPLVRPAPLSREGRLPCLGLGLVHLAPLSTPCSLLTLYMPSPVREGGLGLGLECCRCHSILQGLITGPGEQSVDCYDALREV